MTGYLIFWAVSLVGLAAFLAYWVRRIDRGHRERMAAIEAAASADQARFEAEQRAWDEEDAKARVAYDTQLAAIRDKTEELETLLDADYSAAAEAKDDSDRPLIPTREEIEKLPRWVKVAFAARCARRVLPLYRHSSPDASARNVRVIWEAVGRAEQLAANGGSGSRLVDARSAAAAAREVRHAAHTAMGVATFLAGGDVAAADAEVAGYAADITLMYVVRFAVPEVDWEVDAPSRDFNRLVRLAEKENWTDDTPVPPSVFGPMWEGEPPPWWTDDVLAGLPLETGSATTDGTEAKVEQKEEETAGG